MFVSKHVGSVCHLSRKPWKNERFIESWVLRKYSRFTIYCARALSSLRLLAPGGCAGTKIVLLSSKNCTPVGMKCKSLLQHASILPCRTPLQYFPKGVKCQVKEGSTFRKQKQSHQRHDANFEFLQPGSFGYYDEEIQLEC